MKRVVLLSLLGAAFGGACARAGDALVDLQAVNVADMLANVQGGLARRGAVLDKLDLIATYTGDDHGWPGVSAMVDLQATDAADFSGSVVGDAQAVSSIDAPAGVRVLDAWVAKDFDGRGGFKTGIIDLNTEFDVQQTAALFLNGARGIGADYSQSGDNGPSIFPSTGLGLVGWWLPFGHWQLKAGVFEDTPGDPNHPGRTDLSLSNDKGVLAAFEARYRPTPDVVIGAGSWTYSAGGQSGAYAIVDGALDENFSAWLRAGAADGDIDATAGGGVVYTQDRAQLGVSFSTAHFRAGNAETSLEATFAYAFSDHLTVQPDLQYVVAPSGEHDDALVLGLRVTAQL